MTKVTKNVSLDKEVTDWFDKHPEYNKSGLINSLLKDFIKETEGEKTDEAT